jgi:gamma-glutamylcyclotransferase (GGCT)/AIG2-like uncharacterized protein YtfP
MSIIPSNLIAVYGTLRKDQSNWTHHIKNNPHTYLGTHKVSGYYLMSLGGFPCSLPAQDKNWGIQCDLFMVNDYTLENIDHLEGVAQNWYERVEVETPKGKAYMYMYSPKSFKNLYGTNREFNMFLNGNWLDKNDMLTCDKEDILDITCKSFLTRAYAIAGVSNVIYLPKPQPPKPALTPVAPLFTSRKIEESTYDSNAVLR